MKKNQNKIVLFPGMLERMLEEAQLAAEQSRYSEANELFENVLSYRDGDEYTLSVYAHSLYETKQFEKAKEICEQLLALKPQFYLEAMELYLTVCMQLKQFLQVEKLIQTMFDEQVIPTQQVEKFRRIQHLNEEIALNKQMIETYEVQEEGNEEDELLELEANYFLQSSKPEQLMVIHQLSERNIRPFKDELKKIIESSNVHPFIQSLLLVLLVEQEVDLTCTVAKLGYETSVNTAKLPLPTKTEQFQAVSVMVREAFEHNPSQLEVVEHLLSKHAIVAYPFGWQSFTNEEIFEGYTNYIQAMFGENIAVYTAILEKIQHLDNLSELQ